MAISGGALLPLLMGWLLDLGWKERAFIVPVVCFAYLLLLALQRGRKQPIPEQKAEALRAA
jgi:fucose permease